MAATPQRPQLQPVGFTLIIIITMVNLRACVCLYQQASNLSQLKKNYSGPERLQSLAPRRQRNSDSCSRRTQTERLLKRSSFDPVSVWCIGNQSERGEEANTQVENSPTTRGRRECFRRTTRQRLEICANVS